MPHLDVAGATLYWESDGHASAPALLLIHAGVATLRMWDPLIEDLARDHHVIRYDTRGYGATTAGPDPYVEHHDALAVLDHLGVATATVIGASRGGRIGIDLTLEAPERVTGLVLLAAGLGGDVEHTPTAREQEAGDAVDAAADAGDVERALILEARLWAIGPERDPADVDPAFIRTAEELHLANAPHQGWHAEALPPVPPAAERLEEIDVPALVMVGDDDLSRELQRFETFAEGIPDADSCMLPDTAHLPSVERPEHVLAVLRPWLGVHAL